MPEYDPWATSAGLVDEFTADILDAFFEFDPEYNDGESLILKLEVQSDDEGVGQEGNGHDFLKIPVGKGFETNDKGKTAAHESGKEKNVPKTGGLGSLFESAKEVPGLVDELKGRGNGLNDSAIWKGLKGVGFHRKPMEFENRESGEKVTYNRMQIVAWGGAKGDTAKAEVKAEATEAKTETTGDSADGPKLDPKLKFALKKAAKAAADHDAFVEEALSNIDGVASDDDVAALVMDEDFYNGLKA